ncbi:hypothetical protein LZ31DRAFT_259483 [Colletotrichum somersetense]|nr:hypothetical protein LZ31DRAFT_259483 [Colletotrichum somersetense]
MEAPVQTRLSGHKTDDGDGERVEGRKSCVHPTASYYVHRTMYVKHDTMYCKMHYVSTMYKVASRQDSREWWVKGPGSPHPQATLSSRSYPVRSGQVRYPLAGPLLRKYDVLYLGGLLGRPQEPCLSGPGSHTYSTWMMVHGVHCVPVHGEPWWQLPCTLRRPSCAVLQCMQDERTGEVRAKRCFNLASIYLDVGDGLVCES